MNCPQCQERLDERLDQLRPGLQAGTLSRADAHVQALAALEETARDCSECAAELRTHTNLRLSLMMPDSEPVGLPADLRMNVRRALERENTPRFSSSPWRPFTGLAWTGGAVLSALGLFIIARPFLMESAQKPLPSSIQSAPDSSATSDVPAVAPKNSASGGMPKAVARPVTPAIGRAAPAPLAKMHSNSGVAPSVAARPSIVAQGKPAPAVPAPPISRVAPPQLRVGMAPPRFAEKPRPHSSTSNRPRLSALPPVSTRKIDEVPNPGFSGPSFGGGGAGKSAGLAPSVPVEPHLDASLLAVSGKVLGLTVRVVPASPAARTENRMANMFKGPTVEGGAPQNSTSSPAPDNASSSASPPSVAPPSPSAPATPNSPTVTPREFRRSRPMVGAHAPMVGAPAPMVGAHVPENDASQTAEKIPPGNAPKPSVLRIPSMGTLLVSVKHTVVNARIVGQVQGRAGEGVILWSGTATADKSISVPLAPVNAVKGDTVEVSMQQQVSLGQTKTLTTTSIVAP